MAVNDVFRVAVVGSLHGQQIVSVFHYKQATNNVTANSDVKELALAWKADVMTPYVEAMSQDYTGLVIEARSMPIGGAPMVGHDQTEAVVGDVAQDALPPASAAVIRRITGFLGRKYRGRLFMPAVPVGWVSEGRITDAGGIAIYGSLANAMKAVIDSPNAGAPTFTPVIAAYEYTPPLVHPTSVRSTVITGCTLDKIVRSQRRREIGVGA